MPKIHLLPKNLSNQIAAGEVIERPFSVVKELVENALDAGAQSIAVHLIAGGKEKIEVIDNGSGMDAADAALALQRFATSKIKNEDDLFNIHTFGFRGEALPSIASVSILTLQTKTSDAAAGQEIRVRGGETEYHRETGVNTGTRVVVEHLFFNIPARQKYLKSDTTELSHIVDYVTSIALIHPEVAFVLTHNGKKVFDLAAISNLLDRIADLFGPEVRDELMALETEQPHMKLQGFISNPRYTKANAKYEFLFVNSRPVKNPVIHKAILEGYERTMEKGAYPFFVLNLHIDPSRVDVNVHPRKLEVRFENATHIFAFFQKAVGTTLEQHFLSSEPLPQSAIDSFAPVEQHTPKLSTNFSSRSVARSPYAQKFRHESQVSFFKPVRQETVPYDLDAGKGRRSASPTEWDLPTTSSELYFKKILGQMHRSYILFETENGFGVADQHAVHEIILYQKIKKQYREHRIEEQRLLLPESFDIPLPAITVLENNTDFLSSLGFSFERIGKQSIALSAIPAVFAKADVAKVFLDLLDECDQYSQRSLEERHEKIWATMACRAAVKFGDSLSLDEQQGLLSQLQQLNAGYSCPHGRPVIKEFSLMEMLKWFKRPG